MKGNIITFSPKNSLGRVKFNHELFGRIIYRNYRGKKYVYYSPGILDDTKFFRLSGGKVFIAGQVDVEGLRDLADITVEEASRDPSEMLLMTGKEYWERVAKEKGLLFKKGN